MATQYRITTSLGTIDIQLDADKAPLHAANFAKYADAGFFDGLIFHRVIPNFMIQGGGLNKHMDKRATHGPIKNESFNGLKNLRGTLAAARLTDPDTATSQFFINLKDNDFLDANAGAQKPGYSVFGKVTAGMEVVDAIAAVRTGTVAGHGDVPLTPVTIDSVKAIA